MTNSLKRTLETSIGSDFEEMLCDVSQGQNYHVVTGFAWPGLIFPMAKSLIYPSFDDNPYSFNIALRKNLPVSFPFPTHSRLDSFGVTGFNNEEGVLKYTMYSNGKLSREGLDPNLLQDIVEEALDRFRNQYDVVYEDPMLIGNHEKFA